MYIILFIYENEFLTHIEQPNDPAQSSMNLTKLTWVKLAVARYDLFSLSFRCVFKCGILSVFAVDAIDPVAVLPAHF
jgi:hypothetical protein